MGAVAARSYEAADETSVLAQEATRVGYPDPGADEHQLVELGHTGQPDDRRQRDAGRPAFEQPAADSGGVEAHLRRHVVDIALFVGERAVQGRSGDDGVPLRVRRHADLDQARPPIDADRPQGAELLFVRQVAPAIDDLAGRRTQVSELIGEYDTGAWGDESRDYHVAVRDKKDFVTFRTQDVGEPGHVQRVAGKRESGSWDTVKWLISKQDAHVEGGKLVPDTEEVSEVLAKLGSEPRHVKGDVFEAEPRPDVPEREKPTPAQRRARSANIKKAQAARQARGT